MTLEFKNELKGERLVLKRTLPSLKLAKLMFETVNKNREHLEQWLPWVAFTKKPEDSAKYLFDKEKEEKEGKKVEYGIYIQDNYIGNIGFFDIDENKKSGEIGYWISKDFTRKGYMTEAVKILEKEVFENLKLNRIQIKCDERNEPSSSVAKKCGYTFEGKLREDDWSEHFQDMRNTLVYSKLKSEFK